MGPRPPPQLSTPRHRPVTTAADCPRPGAGASPGQLPGAGAAAAEGREGAKYRANTKLSHTHVRPPKPYLPKAAFPERSPQPLRAPTPERTPSDITLPQLQRCVVQAGGDGNRGGRVENQGVEEQPSDAVLFQRDQGIWRVPPGGLEGRGGPRNCPLGCDSGGLALPGAGLAGFPGGGGGAPRNGHGG